MRTTQIKLFKKNLPYGHRDYFVLNFRQLLYSNTWILFLHYPGDSSRKLNDLRYLAAHDAVKVKLLLRRWLPSIFVNNNRHWIPFHSSLLMLYSTSPTGLLTFLQRPQFQPFAEWFFFCGLSCQGFISQEPCFSYLLEHPGKSLVQVLQFFQGRLLPLWHSCLYPVLTILNVLITFSKTP